ncbi:hypothetical protein pipiens_005278 [Culex pipiens pipiens]|uniref:RING-type domain-containing protein n=1 Tax=Culex pipiens pipiens TaxID=38569 RepID=A0ABD1E0K3_CULPP
MNILQFCEICFRRADAVGILLISSCRHMFCRRCSPTDRTRCAVCSLEARIIDLCEQTMPEPLKEYFDLDDDQLTKSYKVAQFQSEKMDKLIARKLPVLAKYEEKKQTIRKLKEHSDSLKQAILQETTLIRKLQERRPASVAQSVAALERNMRKLAVKRSHHGPGSTSSGSSHQSRSRKSNATGSKRVPVTSPDDALFKVPTFSPSLGRAATRSAELVSEARERMLLQQAMKANQYSTHQQTEARLEWGQRLGRRVSKIQDWIN